MMRTRAMEFPVTLFHKDNGTPEFAADARHSKYGQYPITVHTQEDYDRLGPGWFDNALDAAAWVPDAESVVASDLESGNAPSDDPIQAASDLLSGNVDAVNELIAEVSTVDSLNMLAEVEAAGKNRKGVQAAIAARLETLQSGTV